MKLQPGPQSVDALNFAYRRALVIRWIKDHYPRKEQLEIARFFELSPTVVSRIITGKKQKDA